MTFWEKLRRWFGWGKGRSAQDEESLRLGLEKARREFKEAVGLIQRLRARLAALEKGGTECAGEVSFCRQDLDEAEARATDAFDSANRLQRDLKALSIQRKGEEFKAAPAVSRVELEEIRREIGVQRLLVEGHERALEEIAEEEYSAERKNAVLSRPRKSKARVNSGDDTPRIEPAAPRTRPVRRSEPPDAVAVGAPSGKPREKRELER